MVGSISILSGILNMMRNMGFDMSYRDAFDRAVITFVAGATAAPLTAAVFDVSFFKAAGIAGLVAVWNWVGRSAQAWLDA